MFNRDWFKRQSDINYGGIQNISYVSRVQVSFSFFAKGLLLPLFLYLLLKAVIHSKTFSLNITITFGIGLLIYSIYGYFKSQKQFLETTEDVEQKLLLEYNMHPIRNQSMYPKLFTAVNDACNELKFEMPNVYLIDDDDYDDFQNICGFIDENEVPYLIVSKALVDNCNDDDLYVLVMAELLMIKSHWNELIIKNAVWDRIVSSNRWGNILIFLLILASIVFATGIAVAVVIFILAIWGTRGQIIDGFRNNRFDQAKMIQKIVSSITNNEESLQEAYEYLNDNVGTIDLDNSSQDILGMMWLRPFKPGATVLPLRLQLKAVGIQVSTDHTVDTVKKSLSSFKWW